MASRLRGAPTSCPPPKKPRWGPKPIAPRPQDRGGWVRAHYRVSSPFRQGKTKTEDISPFLLALPKCVTTWKKRERLTIAGGASGCRVFVCILPSPSPSLLLSGLFVWGLLPTVTLWRVLGMVCRGNQKYTLYGFG